MFYHLMLGPLMFLDCPGHQKMSSLSDTLFIDCIQPIAFEYGWIYEKKIIDLNIWTEVVILLNCKWS